MKKINLNSDGIFEFYGYAYTKYSLKSYREYKLLLEAFRRLTFLTGNGNKTLDDPMLGLGSPSQYKSKYFTPSFQELKRCSNWYKLNQEGKTIVQDMIKTFHFPKENRDTVNQFLFGI